MLLNAIAIALAFTAAAVGVAIGVSVGAAFLLLLFLYVSLGFMLNTQSDICTTYSCMFIVNISTGLELYLKTDKKKINKNNHKPDL